jgi:hypothetical protein
MKAQLFGIDDADAEILFFSSGIFVLGNGDLAELVVMDPIIALLQTDFDFIDAFPNHGGAPAVSLSMYERKKDAFCVVHNMWISDF